MSSNGYLAQIFVSVDAVKIGRLIVNPIEPHEDYLDPVCTYTPEIIRLPSSHYVARKGDTEELNPGLQLGKVIQFSKLRRRFDITTTATELSVICQLANSRMWFKSLLQDDGNRRWLEEVVESGEEVYLITGLHVMADAAVMDQHVMDSSFTLAFQVPVVEAVTAAVGGLPISGDLVNPGVNMSKGKGHSTTRSFIAPGVQVAGVQYRKVRFKWYSSRDLDRSKLQKGSLWLVHGRLRGHDSAVNDVMEVDLSGDDEPEEAESKVET